MTARFVNFGGRAWTAMAAVALTLANSGCVRTVVSRSTEAVRPTLPDFDLAAVQRIAVTGWSGPGAEAVTEELVRRLVATRWTVVRNPAEAELVLSGTVTTFRPQETLVVFLGPASGSSEAGSGTLTNAIASRTATSGPAAVGPTPGSSVVAMSAAVAVTARWTDRARDRALWLQSEAYEGADLAAALEPTADLIVRGLLRRDPQSGRRP